MKIIMGIVIAAILCSLLYVYLDKRADRPIYIPAFHPAQRVKKEVVRRPHGELPVDITGPVTKRLIKKVIPAYPDWAQEQGIRGVFRAGISVNPEGSVKSYMPVLQTSCSAELDEVALQALKQWKFRAVSPTVGDQEGVVTFRFVLMDPKPSQISKPCQAD